MKFSFGVNLTGSLGERVPSFAHRRNPELLPNFRKQTFSWTAFLTSGRVVAEFLSRADCLSPKLSPSGLSAPLCPRSHLLPPAQEPEIQSSQGSHVALECLSSRFRPPKCKSRLNHLLLCELQQ